MTTRRIVLVLPDPPLPFGNAASRWFWVLIRGLVARGHDVTTFAVYRSESERDATLASFAPGEYDLRLFQEPRTQGLAQKWRTWRRPYSYPFSEKLQRDLKQRLGAGFDVLHLEQLWTGWVGWNHATQTLLNIHYLFQIDLASRPRGSIKDRVLRHTTLRAERSLLRRFSHITTLTPRLTQRVKEIARRARVETVPLALDLTKYSFETRTPAVEHPVVTLIGSFDWHPSLTAGERLLTRLWPEIKRRVPSARLQLVGRNAQRALGKLAQSPDITIAENVPDIAPYFSGADVMVYAPQQASGMKVKILESFAFGLPVVTTLDGVEGIPAVPGIHAEIAEDDTGLVDGVVRLLEDKQHWAAMRLAARILVQTHCDPQKSLDSIELSYDAIRDPRMGT